MSTISDPELTAVERAGYPDRAQLVRQPSSKSMAVTRRSRWRVGAMYTAIGLAIVLTILRLIASALAIPLDAPAAGAAAPSWMVDVTTASTRSATALVYGPDVGVQFVQVPAGVGGTSEKRVVPARLARGELHFVSLSPTSLVVRAAGPPGSGVAEFRARSPVITAFQNKDGAGVRAGW